jgi:hypothetical protein
MFAARTPPRTLLAGRVQPQKENSNESIHVGEADDAPGVSFMGMLLMIGAVALGVSIARRRT